jgi:hypothetical protein
MSAKNVECLSFLLGVKGTNSGGSRVMVFLRRDGPRGLVLALVWVLVVVSGHALVLVLAICLSACPAASANSSARSRSVVSSGSTSRSARRVSRTVGPADGVGPVEGGLQAHDPPVQFFGVGIVANGVVEGGQGGVEVTGRLVRFGEPGRGVDGPAMQVFAGDS